MATFKRRCYTLAETCRISCLFLALVLSMSCNKDFSMQPEVNMEKIQELQDGTGRYILHFTPSIQEDIIIQTTISYEDSTSHNLNQRLKIPAGTKDIDIYFDTAYIPNKEFGMEYTVVLTKIYGDCTIGTSSKITFTNPD